MSATLRELCRFLSSFPNIQMSEEECEALAVAAISGHAEAEFMIGSVFDAAEEADRAMEWYSRSASREYLPAMLQLYEVR
jgi:TPR repeat protein